MSEYSLEYPCASECKVLKERDAEIEELRDTYAKHQDIFEQIVIDNKEKDAEIVKLTFIIEGLMDKSGKEVDEK